MLIKLVTDVTVLKKSSPVFEESQTQGYLIMR